MEAIPIRAAKAVGIVEDILTDQDTCFRSKVLKELLKVSQIHTSVYLPQTDGLVERFNQTIKQI